ncbi:AAA family ATPase [Clavibacter michiganensis subsp. michiganensis]|uniref:AAA family ATPase n=1 Tax=Clavibacter michiganensis TaxID=28447 RepID=UPI001FF133CA|nr:AAA family ATPase [Clavibacter michiganensis]UOW03937.1 AAA family ATPase [Clavibacter michiganensis subsp. michiganensis]
MRIEAVEIKNFRKLASVRLDLAKETTVLVGANNSGKTSALIALRSFLKDGMAAFSKNDLTLSLWQKVNDIGLAWADSPTVAPEGTWAALLPSLDVWLQVEDAEVHRVSALMPTLDWAGGRVGVRFTLQLKNEEDLVRDFCEAWTSARALSDEWRASSLGRPDADELRQVQDGAGSALRIAPTGEQPIASLPINGIARGGVDEARQLALWPMDLIDFLGKHFSKYFELRHYLLDPARFCDPEDDSAVIQVIPTGTEPLEANPLKDIILIDEINAQRGFGDIGGSSLDDAQPGASGASRLSMQLSAYYKKHLDPSENPRSEDLAALNTIAAAQYEFDARLKVAFKLAFDEMAGLSYPGVSDPKIRVASKLSASESLRHESAVSFELDTAGAPVAREIYLPEGQNGLGYQNLISMVFRFMSFRDRWMRVGKAASPTTADSIQPIHLVLVEEPEAHLHVQVQQVFAKKAFGVLRNHANLGDNTTLTTQLLISTHSSHIAHELPYDSLRYFRRLRAGTNDIDVPTSSVINVGPTFGSTDETRRFVARYIRVQHAEIFFADALILVEGSAERMLVPLMIKEHHPDLHQAFVSMLEIGGSHAHRLRPLIDALKIPTLIITDLDPKTVGGSKAPTQRASGQISANPTLKQWLHVPVEVDALLALDGPAKVLKVDDQYAVRFAYQTAINLQGGNLAGEALPGTFEDALAFTNIEVFKRMDGFGLTKKIRDALSGSTDVATVAHELHEALKTGTKAQFALDVLAVGAFEELIPPAYIDEALVWLTDQIRTQDTAVSEVEQSE